MRTLAALLLLFFFVSQSYGQFEKGYLITKDNKRTECLIKKKDLKINPTEFSYKLDNSSAIEVGDITSVIEFGIPGSCKFIKADVKIDRSSTLATALIGNEHPDWSQEQLFLKVIVEGKANLYAYDGKTGKKFFYSVIDKDSAINQLVYKRFFIGSSVAENNSFKNQLLTDLNCPNVKLEDVEDLTYTTEDLGQYFESYNKWWDTSKSK